MSTAAGAIVVHGHFYQPPRENPWTEEVPREPSAAPFHDWNARIAMESYRPNAFARVVDDHGRVVSIVNNYEHLSFDVGPTLSTWLEEHAPEAWQRVLEGDAKGGGAMAQAYFHVILPLATERDVRTLVRWGVAEFTHRYGRRPEGIWLPETAVDDAVLAVLAEEEIGFTVLAPTQAARVRALADAGDGSAGADWVDVADGSVDTRVPYRWLHPDGTGRGVDLVFYDGGLSHAVAFELSGLSSEVLVERMAAAAAGGGLVVLAADGETFGHHHHWGDRTLAYGLTVEAPRRGMAVTTVAEHLRDHRPRHQAAVKRSAWSCAHGVARWQDDCGCSTGGAPGWDQRWRAPLRAALDVVRAAVDDAFERRARGVLADPWAARDAYIDVLLGRRSTDDFAAHHVTGDRVEAFTLLEAQRHQLAMYTSCGWFFNDLAGLETVQVLRYAARALDLLAELGEEPPITRFLDVLAEARSNVADEGDGRQVWARHVEPVRVDAERVVAHVALADLLAGQEPGGRVGAFHVEVGDHAHHDRGAVALCTGRVRLVHRRTGRTTEHVYAAVHLGGLEVLGAARPAADPESDRAAVAELTAAFAAGAPATQLLRRISDGFGPREFGLADALPDAAEAILQHAARSLADRYAAAYDRLFADHRATLVALSAAGYPMPAELRAPAELALTRRLEAALAAPAGSLDPADYGQAVAVVREAEASGARVASPAARAGAQRLALAAAEQAVALPARAARAVELIELLRGIGLQPVGDRVQEVVYEAMQRPSADRRLLPLAAALDLAVPSPPSS